MLDFEPMWTPSNHALSTTLPAILALADIRDISGKDVITALVKGIELQAGSATPAGSTSMAALNSTRRVSSDRWARRSRWAISSV